MVRTVLELFIHRVPANRDKAAIVYKDLEITYQELNERSNTLCALLQSKGVKPGDNVPLVARRTPEFIIGLLGINKAGANYIPIDAHYPEKRIRDITTQCSSAVIVVSHASLAQHVSDGSVDIVAIDNLREKTKQIKSTIEPNPDSAVYIIFTSGTTGKPKGVVITHSALLNLILWHNEKFDMNETCRSTLIAGLGFDVAQWEIWSALVCGATLFLPEEETRLQPAALLNFFAQYQLTHAFVPTVLVPDIVSPPL